ncbi:MAG: molecular chaperone TorD family protein [Methanobacteriota archaeon]
MMEVRANVYAFLARMYLEEPPLELAEDIINGRFFPAFEPLIMNEEMEEGLRILKQFAKGYKKVDKLHEDLQSEYIRLFIGPVDPPALPYESKYSKEQLGETVLRAKRAYAKAGIGKSKSCSEPEDHVALELDFMRYLCDKESNKFLSMQREFLHNCLLNWVPKFCENIIRSNSSFYKGIAKMTKGFLLFEDSDRKLAYPPSSLRKSIAKP